MAERQESAERHQSDVMAELSSSPEHLKGTRGHRVPCDTFEAFVRRVRDHETTGWLYRGQSQVDWPLASMWERHRQERVSALYETFGVDRDAVDRFYQRGFLESFRRLALGLPGIRKDLLRDDRDALVVGRHYGLVTPLLDWTQSPYVALFFACFDRLTHIWPSVTSASLRFEETRMDPRAMPPVAVWALMEDDIEEPTVFEIIPGAVEEGYRQRAQASAFTYLNSREHIGLESYLASRNLAGHLTCFEIPGDQVGEALRNLKLMNISYARLFPDLIGAAIESNLDALDIDVISIYFERRTSVPED